MAFHIVTSRCFLACDKVTSIVIEELPLEPPATRNRKKKQSLSKATKIVSPNVKTPQKFSITIFYYPISMTAQQYSNSMPQESSMSFHVPGRNTAFALYAEIVKEVQEQHPNEGYLDKLVTKMLEGVEFQTLEPKVYLNDD